MSSETVFLQSTDSNSSTNPNFAQAQGFALGSNYNQSSSGALVEAQTQTLVQGGVALAIAEAQAVFFESEPVFSLLFTDSTTIGLDGTYQGNANSTTKVVASFAVGANQTFSFNFSADLALSAKEIENPNVEYNEAESKSTFLVLDTTEPNKPKVIDFVGLRGSLISSMQFGDLIYGGSRNFTINSYDKASDVNGNNGKDSLTGQVTGSYERKFTKETTITLVEIDASAAIAYGDNLIDNLGQDVIYGTIGNDNLKGDNGVDKIYASLGDDKLNGQRGDDILEGGQGNDWLDGGEGNDQLNAGGGKDVLTGGRGSDVLVGGEGADIFFYQRGNSLRDGELDIIQDFQVGTDKIVFQGWGNINTATWLNGMLSQGKITNTNDGLLFNFNDGPTQGKILLTGLNSNLITAESIEFI
ncbi:MAG: hypothetical protein KME32_30070 [Mojavia pulchra JT2-VF2]|jgi:Ca2+-binding RTX toxin-like protein|uniref:Peptidase M10 serralysin C-terminal domain-containing protein n=1 Tax=Mojavia pulchra JT2-VF2 TaxID=287848 RepID=A0A951Q5R3_9NOST|nr:hypothetical protein [Mojavia pulchra JT2-VF2]